MIDYTLDASGLNLRLQTLEEKLKNTRPLMEQIGEYVIGSARKNIDEGGRLEPYRPNIWGTHPLKKTGESYAKIRKEVVSDTRVEVSSGGGDAVYSHTEYAQTITPRMRKYFLWQYKETGLVQWLQMAITSKTSFIKPQRRYMMFQEPLDIEEIKKMVENHLAIKN